MLASPVLASPNNNRYRVRYVQRGVIGEAHIARQEQSGMQTSQLSCNPGVSKVFAGLKSHALTSGMLPEFSGDLGYLPLLLSLKTEQKQATSFLQHFTATCGKHILLD